MHAASGYTEAAGDVAASVTVRCEEAGQLLIAAGGALTIAHGIGVFVPIAIISRGLMDRHLLDAQGVLVGGVALLVATLGMLALGVALTVLGHRRPTPGWRAIAIGLAVLAIACTPVAMVLSVATTLGLGMFADVAAAALLLVALGKLVPGDVRIGLEERQAA